MTCAVGVQTSADAISSESLKESSSMGSEEEEELALLDG